MSFRSARLIGWGNLVLGGFALLIWWCLSRQDIVNEAPVTATVVHCSDVAAAERAMARSQSETVRFLLAIESASVADALKAAYPTVQVVSVSARVAVCDVPLALARTWVEQGLTIPGVRSFDVEKPIQLYSAVATGATYLDLLSLQTVSALDGGGEVIAVIDTGISTGDASRFHKDLLPALYGMAVEPSISSSKNLTPEDTDEGSHGTHVAGCAVAQGVMNAKVRGSAPGAALYFQRIMKNESLYVSNDTSKHFERSLAVGASIINCSWGHSNNLKTVYDTYSLLLDEFVWDYPEVLICVAVGNSGEDIDGDDVVDAESVYSSEAYAKNALVVGAQESHRSDDVIKNSDFENNTFTGATLAADKVATPADGKTPGMFAVSSRGPLEGGRIAPMLVAPGTAIYSTERKGGVVALYGTSMATPLVSGAAAVLRQYLREVLKIEQPTMAAVRAGLIVASETLYPGQFGTGKTLEIPKTSPNSVEGWGALKLGKVLQGGERKTETFGVRDRISLTKATATTAFTIENVQANTTLSVALSWVDYPSAALTNDYDLELVSPSGTVHTLDDHQNPIERLRVAVGADKGTWTVRVRAYKIGKTGTGNVAAVAWRAETLKGPGALPTKGGLQVPVTVTLPQGVTPYRDYPVWPAPGTHWLATGRAHTIRFGAKLPTSFSKRPETLSGWILKEADGARQQGRSETFLYEPQSGDEIRWYKDFPGAAFRLR